MRLGYFYFDPLYIGLMLASIAIMAAAQIAVKSAYSKYSRIGNRANITGRQVAEMILEKFGIVNVSVERVSGKLTDHYDPRAGVIRLSDGVYGASTIAAIGIAAHEAGHAVQHAKGYAPLKLRNAIIPVSSYGPSVGIILLILGSVLNFSGLIWLGIGLFSFAFIFQLVTLPVEFNASRRAVAAIGQFGLFSDDEKKGAARVLRAAALTYVGAMLQSFLTLLYYIIRFTGNRRS